MAGGKFEKVEGTDFDLEADLVLLAMGFVGPERDGPAHRPGRRDHRPRQRRARRRLRHLGARRLRRRRHGPRPVADRVGDRRGPRRRRGCRPLSDGSHRAACADQAHRGPAALAGPATRQRQIKAGLLDVWFRFADSRFSRYAESGGPAALSGGAFRGDRRGDGPDAVRARAEQQHAAAGNAGRRRTTARAAAASAEAGPRSTARRRRAEPACPAMATCWR